MRFLFIIFLYSVISGYGLYKIKSSVFLASFDYFLGLLFYLGGFLIWLWILDKYPLSLSFSVAAGSLIIVTTSIGFIILGEGLSIYKILGIVLILAGILSISLSK